MRDHRKLRAFSLADELVIKIYQVTKDFPREEMFGLTSQMRRATVSVPANIIEGCSRKTEKEYVNFLNIAFGSLRESGYYIELCFRLHYMDKVIYDELVKTHEELSKVLGALIRCFS
jgi:four helix bundle protein